MVHIGMPSEINTPENMQAVSGFMLFVPKIVTLVMVSMMEIMLNILSINPIRPTITDWGTFNNFMIRSLQKNCLLDKNIILLQLKNIAHFNQKVNI